MAIFKKKQFEELAEEKGKYCISIYIPTQRQGENKESKIYLKNKIAGAEKELADFGLKQKEIDEYLKPLKELHEDVNLWRHLSDALVVFSSKNRFEYHTLPIDVDDFLLVSDRFYVLPLIDLFNQNRLFYILSLSQKKNRLYEATRHEIAEIDVEDIFPETIYDSVGYDVEQKSLQMRGEQSGTEGTAMYHGKGEGKDDKNKEVIKYLEDVDKGLNNLLEDSEIPVVVAAVDDIFGQFKKISNYKNIFSKNVPGNYDDEDIVGVHEKALGILVPYLEQIKNEKKEKYSQAIGKTSASLEDIVVSADAGKIDTLFVAKGEHIWGTYKRDEGTIDKHEEKQKLDICFIDFAARNTFMKSGKVFIEEQEHLPENTAPANAVFRY